MKSQWLNHEDRRLLYIDLSDFKENVRAFETELTETVNTIGQEMYTQPPHSVLVLVDLRNTAMTQTTQRLLSERIKDTREYVHKTAVVGMTGIRRMFLDFFSRLAGTETMPFDDPESAKAWLIQA